MAEIDARFILPFIKATQSIFSQMIDIDVQREKIYIKHGYRMFGEVTSMIGMSGTVTGTASVSFKANLAVLCTERMLREKVENGVNDVLVHDCVGEFINMIVGMARSSLAQTPYKFEITLPTIISGKNHEVYSKKGARSVVILFKTEHDDRFSLEVCVPEKLPEAE